MLNDFTVIQQAKRSDNSRIMKLKEKVTIVTGGGSGIGQAIACLFAAEGAQVVVADIDAKRALETVGMIAADGGTATASTVDVTDGVQVNALAAEVVEKFGRIDILVNNAATSRGNDIMTIDEETWDFNLDLVLKSVYLCSKAVLPTMIERKQGVIINIGSVNGISTQGMEAYSAGKAGVVSLSRNMSTKYAHLNVRVNVISPGTVETPLWEPFLAENPDILDEISEWIPMGRVGQPDDIAKAALFLASDDASWITGANLVVDGGMTASR